MVKKWSVSYPAVNGVEQRRVYVYLPTMYEADPERRYPVLYMFDGQNGIAALHAPRQAEQHHGDNGQEHGGHDRRYRRKHADEKVVEHAHDHRRRDGSPLCIGRGNASVLLCP